MKRKKVLDMILSLILIAFGAIMAGFAIGEFLLPNSILDGGVTGISMIFSKQTGLPLSIFIFIINLPLIFIGYKNLGKKFLVKAVFAMSIFSIFLHLFENMENISGLDKLLGTVFGGLFLGLGAGLVIRCGGCLDGSETIAILISKKTNFSLGQIILAVNIVIYSVAGFIFGWQSALYSLLTYFITFKIIDMVEIGFDTAKAAIIITNQAQEITEDIYTLLGRTVTKLDCTGLVSGETVMLYCVLTRLELSELKEIVEKDDRKAFVTITDVSEIIGKHHKKVSQKVVEKIAQ